MDYPAEPLVLLLGPDPEPRLTHAYEAFRGAQVWELDVVVDGLWLSREHLKTSHHFEVVAQVPTDADLANLAYMRSRRRARLFPQQADPTSPFGLRADLYPTQLIEVRSSVGAVVLRGDHEGLLTAESLFEELLEFDASQANAAPTTR